MVVFVGSWSRSRRRPRAGLRPPLLGVTGAAPGVPMAAAGHRRWPAVGGAWSGNRAPRRCGRPSDRVRPPPRRYRADPARGRPAARPPSPGPAPHPDTGAARLTRGLPSCPARLPSSSGFPPAPPAAGTRARPLPVRHDGRSPRPSPCHGGSRHRHSRPPSSLRPPLRGGDATRAPPQQAPDSPEAPSGARLVRCLRRPGCHGRSAPPEAGGRRSR